MRWRRRRRWKALDDAVAGARWRSEVGAGGGGASARRRRGAQGEGATGEGKRNLGFGGLGFGFWTNFAKLGIKLNFENL